MINSSVQYASLESNLENINLPILALPPQGGKGGRYPFLFHWDGIPRQAPLPQQLLRSCAITVQRERGINSTPDCSMTHAMTHPDPLNHAGRGRPSSNYGALKNLGGVLGEHEGSFECTHWYLQWPGKSDPDEGHADPQSLGHANDRSWNAEPSQDEAAQVPQHLTHRCSCQPSGAPCIRCP